MMTRQGGTKKEKNNNMNIKDMGCCSSYFMVHVFNFIRSKFSNRSSSSVIQI